MTTKTSWHGCYDDSWKGEIVEEAFSHPAKMARGLVRRIFDYLLETGRLKRGDVVVDPFGGIGTTGMEGASRGVRCFASELEPRFVELAKANIELHRRTWEAFGDTLPVIVQGDSRRLCEVLGPLLADCVVSSPPYADQNVTAGNAGNAMMKESWGTGTDLSKGRRDYGHSPGQLGAMPSGSVDAVTNRWFARLRVLATYWGPGGSDNGTDRLRGYATEAEAHAKCDELHAAQERWDRGSFTTYWDGTGATPCSVDAVVSSPPYEGSMNSVDSAFIAKHHNDIGRNPNGHGAQSLVGTYGDTQGNIGNETGPTFWHAAREIVAQCHAILKPGGVCVWVCKDFVRAKKRVPFSADWVRLCEAEGFRLVEWIEASLVKTDSHPSLFGGQETKTTERKSFFRRLAEKKGSPRIDHEDVLVMERVEGTQIAESKLAAVGGLMLLLQAAGHDVKAACVVSSPPYSECPGHVRTQKSTNGGQAHHAQGVR